MNLEGKAAVITGASRGVGRETALKLAEAGCAVLVNYNKSRDEAEAVVAEAEARGARAMSFQADTAQDAACRAMVDAAVKAFGRLDILMNNAATTEFIPHAEMEALSEALWDRIWAVNVKGPFFCTRAARPHLESSGGQVINISSIAGIAGTGSSIPYCASKAALINMTQTLARAMAPKVRVNAVAPGFIDTKWTRAGLGDQFESAMQGHLKGSAMHRVCGPKDVADAVLSLITGSDLVTGQTLVVDGGALIGSA